MMKGSPNTKGLNIFIHSHSYTGYSDVTTFFKTIKNQLIKTFKLFSKMWVGGWGAGNNLHKSSAA